MVPLTGGALAIAGHAAAQTVTTIPGDQAEVTEEADGNANITVTGLRQQYRGDAPLGRCPDRPLPAVAMAT
jgi:iron complex outermembrane receptor protein